MSDEHAPGEAPDANKPKPIAPRDIASSTAVGLGARLGVTRLKARAAEGAATGAAAQGLKRRPDRSSLMTVLFVVVVLVGTVAVMLMFGR